MESAKESRLGEETIRASGGSSTQFRWQRNYRNGQNTKPDCCERRVPVPPTSVACASTWSETMPGSLNGRNHFSHRGESQKHQRTTHVQAPAQEPDRSGKQFTHAAPRTNGDRVKLQAEHQNQRVKKDRVPEQAQSQQLRVDNHQHRQDHRHHAKYLLPSLQMLRPGRLGSLRRESDSAGDNRQSNQNDGGSWHVVMVQGYRNASSRSVLR